MTLTPIRKTHSRGTSTATAHAEDANDVLLFRRFAVAGLTGRRRDRALTKQLSQLVGFRYVAVDIAAGIITIQTTRELNCAEVANAIDKAGFALTF
jgi:hypothetical protein